MKKSFSNWYEYNRGLFWMLVCSILGISVAGFLVIKYYEPPIKNGVITRLYVDEEHVNYRQISDDVYERVYRGTDSEGNSIYDRVYDYTRYKVNKYFDGKDYIVYIEAPSKKIEDKMLINDIYVTSNRFNRLKLRGEFQYQPEELGDRLRDSNNVTSTVARWSRRRYDMTQYLREEY